MNIVFLGPSLPLTEAKKILPDAWYLPPVRCGDILRVLRFKPKAILIIDGYFENTGSVWHKEILAALDQGVVVAGASSMGALRAAELAEFGMRGIGEVFALYQSQMLNDDDEVTVLHQSSKANYASITDAMVNIRATVAKALAEHIISQDLANQIIATAKSLFYQKRSLKQVCELLIAAGQDAAAIQALASWLSQGGYVDQKALDAKLALHEISRLQAEPPAFKLANTALLSSLTREVSCQPFPTWADELTTSEKVACVSRLLGVHYRYIKRIASLIALASASGENTDYRQLTNNIANYDSSAFVLMFIRLNGDYARYKSVATERGLTVIAAMQAIAPDIYKLIVIMGSLWSIIKQNIKPLPPSNDSMIYYLRQLKTKFAIDSKAQFNDWLQQNDLDHAQLLELITEQIQYDYLVVKNNTSMLETQPIARCCYLDALYLTDCYVQAKRLLTDADYREQCLEINRQALQVEHDHYAFKQDFHGGSEEMQAFINLIANLQELPL